MKKILLMSILFTATILCVGCGNKQKNTAKESADNITGKAVVTEAVSSEDAEVTPTKEASVTEEATKEETKEETKETAKDDTKEAIEEATDSSEDAPDYTVNMVEYKNTDLVKISYPQIEGWSNTEMQDKWNAIFKKEAKTKSEGWGDKDVVEISYEVKTADLFMLSIVCKSYISTEGSAHPSSSLSSCNIYMKTGDKVGLSETADLNTIADRLLNTKFYTIQTEGIKMKEIINAQDIKASKDEVASLLGQFDKGTEGNSAKGYSYWENGFLNLVFEVNHAMGDFVVVTVQE